MGSGRRIRVWDDAWLLGEGAHFTPTPRLDSDMEMRVSALLDYEGGGWNVDLVHQTFVEEEWDMVLKILYPDIGLMIMCTGGYKKWSFFRQIMLLAGSPWSYPYVATPSR